MWKLYRGMGEIMFIGLFTGIISGFILSTQLDLSNMEAFQRGIRQGFRQSFQVGLGSTAGDAVYWLIMLLGQRQIITNIQDNRVYVLLYALFLLLLGLYTAYDLKRFNEEEKAKKNKLLVLVTGPFAAGFTMSILNPSTVLWSFFVTEIFQSRLIPQSLGKAMEPQIFIGLVIGGVIWAAFLAFLSQKSRNLFQDWLLKAFLLLYSILFVTSGISVFAKVF